MELAILTSHVIQYQTPLFKKLAKAVDLTVYFAWDFGMKDAYDIQFKRKISWDIPLLEGFNWKLLRNYSPKPANSFWGQLNPGIAVEFIRNRPDAVLVYGWNGLTEWIAYVTAWILGIKILIHSENPLNQEVLKPRWLLAIKRIGLGFLFKIMHRALYIGEENRKFYEYYGVPDEKLVFVPYAVDNERLIVRHQEFVAQRNELRKKLGLPEDKKLILFTGKLMPKKRPGDLLRAFEKLGGSAVLVFVGDGELREGLESEVGDRNIENVFFVGFKNQTELPLYYEAADVFVLPSGVGETWGLVVNEAMCFGKPVVVSNVVGCGPDLVKEGENGFIFNMGDENELGGALKKALELRVPNQASLDIIRNYSHERGIEGIRRALDS